MGESPMNDKPRAFLFISGGVLCIVLAICAGLLTHNIRLGIQRGNDLVENARDATADVKDYIHTQKAIVESPAYQKQLQATANIGNDVRSVVLSVNSQIIPGLKKNLATLDALQGDLRLSVAAITDLTRHSDVSVNGHTGLLPAVTRTVDSINDLTQNELRDAVAQFAIAGKNLVVITSDPALQSLPGEIEKIAKSLNVSAGNIEVVTEQLAGVTANFNKMSTDAQLKVHSLLNPPPAPFWKRYILYPLRDIGGVAYLLVKVANGL